MYVLFAMLKNGCARTYAKLNETSHRRRTTLAMSSENGTICAKKLKKVRHANKRKLVI